MSCWRLEHALGTVHDMTAIIKWQDPPPVVPLTSGHVPGTRTSPEYDAILSELRQCPGRWALIKSIPGYITGRSASVVTAFRKRGCDVTQRTVYLLGEPGSSTDIYARWPLEF